MKNQKTERVIGTNLSLMVLAVAVLMAAVTGTATAKSLYVICGIDVKPTPVRAYNIEVDGTLTFQVEYGIPEYGLGAMGLAVDSDSGYLFVTYEDTNTIQLLDGKTMTDAGTVKAVGANNLAGIVYDQDKELLYCINRNSNQLFVYDWDSVAVKLTPIPGSPFTLKGAGGYGIALDEINDLLYVANYSWTIMSYKTSDWSRTRAFSVTRRAISVAVDAKNGLVYYGAGYASAPHNYFLCQYNLATRTEAEVQVEPDGGVMGLGVDQSTGLVYMSTGRNQVSGGDNLLVYNSSLVEIDRVLAIGNPTGLAIPQKDISYNPLNLSKTVVGGLEQVPIGGTLSYDICFDNNDNDFSVKNLSIVDALPGELSFVTADGDGVFGEYDPVTHTYAWSYPLVPPETGECVRLTVRVNEGTPPNTIITNSVTMESDETPPTTTGTSVTAKEVVYNSLNVSKGIVDETGCVYADGTITYEICFDNNDNDSAVSNVSIVDILPDEVNFVSADGNGVFGQYDPVAHNYTWLYPSMAPGPGDCLQLVVQVKEDTDPNTVITNAVTIMSDQTLPQMAAVDTVTCPSGPMEPLQAELYVFPNTIKRRPFRRILAIVRLPVGINPGDVADERLVLDPGDLEATHQHVHGKGGRVRIITLFSGSGLLNAVRRHGRVELKVTGKLKSGRTFYAEDTIFVTRSVVRRRW